MKMTAKEASVLAAGHPERRKKLVQEVADNFVETVLMEVRRLAEAGFHSMCLVTTPLSYRDEVVPIAVQALQDLGYQVVLDEPHQLRVSWHENCMS